MINEEMGPAVDCATLLELLKSRARSQPDQRAYTFQTDGASEELHLTYAELDRRARAVAAKLQSLGAPGGRAMLLYPPGLDYIAAFFGCLYADVAAVPVYPPRPNRPMSRFLAIFEDAQAGVALTTSAILPVVDAVLGRDEKTNWIATDETPGDLAQTWDEPPVRGDTLAFIQYTSGSTSSPKGVMLTHANLLHNLDTTYHAFGITPGSRAVIWLPPYHDMGLIGGILQPLYGGFPAVLMSPMTFLQQPYRWLHAVSRHRATVSGGPNFAYDLCVRKITAEQRATLDLSSWVAAFNGAEPIRPETIDLFTKTFEPCGFRREAFYPCYGLAEGTLIVSGGSVADPPVVKGFRPDALAQHHAAECAISDANARKLVSSGRAVGRQRIVVVDPETLITLEPGGVGEVLVSGPSIARGYWNRPDETARTFAAFLSSNADGPFLRTGDLGFLHDGELFITGRIKDLIIIRGRNHYPQDIEATVEKCHPAIRPGCAAAFSVEADEEERLVVATEIKREHRGEDLVDVIDAIRQAITEEHEIQLHAAVLLRPGSLPKTSSGKVQRHACRAAFLVGELEAAGEWKESAVITQPDTLVESQEQFERWLTDQLAARLRVPSASIDAHQSLNRYALDSLNAIELAHVIEQQVAVHIPLERIFEGPTIAELAREAWARRTAPARPYVPAPPAESMTKHPLSAGQRALWFLHQLEPESAAYNVPAAVRLLGDLDVPALHRAFGSLAGRHPILRMTFASVGGEPVQEARNDPSFEQLDASTWDDEAVRKQLNDEANRPFDLQRGPLMRVRLLRRYDREHLLMLNMHHIITDFWSQAVIMRDLGQLYEAERSGRAADLPSLALQYSDFARIQDEMLGGPEGERLRAFWQKQLAGELPILNLRTDRPRPPVQTYRGAVQPVTVDEDDWSRLKDLGRRNNATPFMTLLAAFHVLLRRYTGQRDIVIGAPMAGRSRAQLSNMLGYFVNPVALRTESSGDATFSEHLARARRTVLGAFEHQDYPFATVVEQIQPARDPSRTPVFQVMLALQNAPAFEGQSLTPFALGAGDARVQWCGLSLESFPLDHSIAQFDLTLNAGEVDGALRGALNYNTDLFDASTIARMARHFQQLLRSIVAAPHQRLSELPILTEAEERRQTVEWNSTHQEFPVDSCIHELFDAQASQTPDSVAVIFQDQKLTYRDLARKADLLAARLRALGVGPEALVGICMEGSIEMIVAIAGVLKAGGAYVPLDPLYPIERLAFMIEDACPQLVLTLEKHQPSLPPAALAISLDAAWDVPIYTGAAAPAAASSNAACLIYTSGSTGEPKGVVITHRSIVNLITSFVRSYRADETDRVLPLTAATSASFVGEILPILCTGGAVVLPDREETLDFTKLFELLARHGVTILSTVPAMVRMINQLKDRLPKLRLLMSGGEALMASDIDKLLDTATLINGYGLTETTICSTYRRLDKSDLMSPGAVSIGKPVMNNRVYILDEDLRSCPIGSPGEMYVAGDGLARGYLNNAGLTAERFIPCPFERGERMYRTGDLAAWLPDGGIEFLGRIDHQVKIRGFRIDLGEIETVLDSHQGVRESLVRLRADVPGEKHLVAYIVPRDEKAAPTAGDLLDFLRSKLPGYMVPSAFVVLDAVPRLSSGKIDFNSLPVPEGARPELRAEFVAPRSELEEIIARVWRDALRVEKVGINDNFFDLGGHSLLLTKVHTQIRDALKRDLSLIDLFRYPTVSALARHLSPRETDEPLQIQRSVEHAARRRQARDVSQREIAIIGMTGRFPGARGVEALWDNLRNGVESITFFTDDELEALGIDRSLLSNPDYIKAKGILGDIDLFDAHFFGLNPRETELMDPQHRLMLECCWEALERAGYDADRYQGRVGVYAGESMNTYLITNLLSHMELVASVDTLQASLGNDKDPLTSRVSYKLNLKGPSITIQSASSTSLVAVHVACQSLLDYECDMALAGGASIHLPEKSGYLFHEGGTTSRHGHCRAFDSQADGFVSGNGVGVVVLKRLADALADGDNIYAVIKGSACNNDGSEKVSFMAPSVEGQVELYTMAHAIAGVSPDSISYVEAHGTGTALGDPIEIESLTQAFRTSSDRKGYCAIGSLKTNIGHLDTAAGVCGLIKAAMALHHKMIPPTLHFQAPNPQIDFENSPFFVNTECREWKTNGTPRRAGVTSLGMGGTNAHVILEEAPQLKPSGDSRCRQLLVLSAKTATALEAQTASLIEHLKRSPDADLADVAYTLQCGRQRFNHRRTALCESSEDAIAALETLDPDRVADATEEPGDRSLVFMFTGQGAQHVDMGLGLYRSEPVFRAEVDRCSELLEPHLGFDIRTIIYPPEESSETMTERLRQTAVAQPALFLIEYALAKLWTKWGLRPQAMIGHSLGEYVAACLAGVMALEDALKLVAVRGRLMQQMPPGSMLAVPLPDTELQPLLGPGLSIAAINHPSQSVASGDEDAIRELEEQMGARGIACRRLQTSHAFHSQMMDPMLAVFTETVSKVALKPPRLPYISNVTGTWVRPEQATDPAYWARQLRHAVRFADGLAELLRTPRQVLLEVGPGSSLSTLARQHPMRATHHVVVSSLPHQKERNPDDAHALKTLGRLWLAGLDVDWPAFYEGERRRRVLLPTYPLERRRYWVEPKKSDGVGRRTTGGRRKIDEWFYAPIWKQSRIANLRRTGSAGNGTSTWLLFCDELGLGSRLAARLKAAGHTIALAGIGDRFRRRADGQFEIDPADRRDYDLLLQAIRFEPSAVVHLWGVGRGRSGNGSDRARDDRIFTSLLYLAQALGKQSSAGPLRLWVVSDGLHEVTGEEVLSPEMATILGACRTIPNEYGNITCHSLDVVVPHSGLDDLADQVLRELTLDAPGTVMALRGKSRWVQSYEHVALNGLDGQTRRLREGGVYLVTGGLGGIGMELATYLAQRARARLVLIGRSPFPHRNEWESWLTSHDSHDPTCRQIMRLRALEHLGAEVLVLRADVADLEQLRAVKAAARARFGGVNGIIHAAGVPGGGLIQTRTPQSVEAVFAPKILGTLNLDEVFKDEPLDFVVLCSSITSILGHVGQADYAAASAFLDSFACHKTDTDRVYWVSVNWDAWQSVGMAVNTPVPAELREWRQEELRKGILPAEGVDVFARILQSDLPQVVVSTQDLQTRMEHRGVPVNLEESGKPQELHPRPVLGNAYVSPASESERTIARIWQELLGIEQVGAHDNFFDLGGNSLIALRIIARMKSELGVTLPDVSLFEAPTVRSLARILAPASAGEPALEESRSRGEMRRARAPRRRDPLTPQQPEAVPVRS
ncbi:MAG: amino acid adenylation domain-containing protein [Acidobacteriota bacterium]